MMLWNTLHSFSGVLRHRCLYLASSSSTLTSTLTSTSNSNSTFTLFGRPSLLSFFQRQDFDDQYPQLVGIGNNECNSASDSSCDDNHSDNSWIWFAVPKRKHTRSRKRMKTTVHKRLALKKNIVFDPRTGEVTLKHKLPFNWKEYLPSVTSSSSSSTTSSSSSTSP